MSAKILITGLPNTGKTSLLKPLTDTLVIARDGKPFSLRLPHTNIGSYSTVAELLDLVSEALDRYNTKFKAYPKTITFDSVSRILTDIENNCAERYKGFDVWSNMNKEIQRLLGAISELQDNGINIVLIAHAVWDPDAKKYIETCKGSFAKTGGFLATVDYAINIDIVGNKRIITHKDNYLSRTLLDDIPQKQNVEDFNLQDYINIINNVSHTVEKWSI